MPRILHVIDTPGQGGAETILTYLAGGFNSEGWESRVLVPRDDWIAQRLADDAVECRFLPHHGTPKLRLLRSLVREIQDFRPHLVHAHFVGPGIYCSLASALEGGVPVVCTLHGTLDVDSQDPLLGLKARILSRSRNRIVCVSHHLRSHLQPILGLPARLVEVIHNGIPFPGPGAVNQGLTLEGIDPAAPLIGAVGNIRPPKDYPNLLQAARLVCRAHPTAQFVVLGRDQAGLLKDLLRLRKDLAIEDRVHFLGFRPDVGSVLGSLTIFVSSSETEGLPLATLEAMGIGKPVVATNCGGVPEVIKDGVSGFLVPVKDPYALAKGVLNLLGDPERAAKLGAAARSQVRARFSIASMLGKYASLYESLLKA